MILAYPYNAGSSVVSSSQRTVHPRLQDTVQKHLVNRWRGSLHRPTVEVFAKVEKMVESSGYGELVFDSGCGTGLSTRYLGTIWPDCLVLGVDKSAKRLDLSATDRTPYREGNVVMARMELATFWRLAVKAEWSIHRHYLLYPNPWPKPGHLKRRWHAHPVFPELLNLGGRLEMRCNWEIYAMEFAAALECSGREADIAPLASESFISPFEKKYQMSGHQLWSVSSSL
jgi:tRNA G46 methylase TrmB